MQEIKKMWPQQNAPNIQKQVRKLLRTQYGIRAANEEYYDTKKPRCKFMCDKDAPFERTLPQKVLQALVSPVTRYNLLARHDVGLGKSCAAVSVAYNFAANGQNVLWVSRNQGLARETIQKKLDCFEPLSGKQTMSNEFKADFLGKNSNMLWGNPRLGVQMLSFINFANLIKPVKSDADRERLDALDMREPDIFRDCLLIIDEPHLMYTEGALGTEGRRSLWRDLGDAIDNSYKVSGDNSVTLLLLDATPIISDLDDAARLVNLLIRDPAKKLPLGDALLKELWSAPEKLGERMRGYISYAAGSNDITRFAQAQQYTVSSKVVLDDDEAVFRSRKKKAQAGGNARRVKLDYNYHEQLQVDCAQGSLTKRTTKPERQKLLNCYFERGNYVGSVWLDKSWRDFSLVHNNPDTPVPQYKLDERAKLIEMCRNRAPKAYAIYENIVRLDAQDEANGRSKKKHYIFSGSAKTTSSVGIIAALFAAHDHQKLDFIDTPERKVKWERSAGKKDAYIVMGKSATLYADKVKFRAGTFMALRDDIFAFINKRPDNTYGQEVRFIIFDYSLKEGVDLKDIGYIHMLEKQRTRAEETQALGRALRMCGNCALSYDKGWRIQTFTYDVIPDRLPLLAQDYVGEEKPKDREDLGETWQEHIAHYKDDVENEKDDSRQSYSQSKSFAIAEKKEIFAPYGDYVRQAATNDQTQLLFDRFDDLMNRYSIDYGIYDVYDKDKVRYVIAVDDNLDTLSDLVPVENRKVREMRTMQNLLQEKMNRIHTANMVPILSPMAIAPDQFDFIIQTWAAPQKNYLSTKAKQDVVPSGRALQLFTNRCQYYLWLLAKGYNVLPYRCVKKLNRKLILKTMGVKEEKKVDLKKELNEAFARPVFRPNLSPINSAQNERNIIDRLKNRMDKNFAQPKFRRDSASALRERLNRSFGEAKFLEESENEFSERFLVAKPDSNNIYVRAHKIGQYDTQVTTAFDHLFAQKEQVILQPYVDDARELSVWVVGAEQNEMKVIQTTDDALFDEGEEEAEGEKRKRKKKNRPIVTARDLCERLMRDMRDEVGKLWCVKFHLLQVFLDGEWLWHVDKITLRMDMRDWPKDKIFDSIDEYYNRLHYLTRPHNEQ